MLEKSSGTAALKCGLDGQNFGRFFYLYKEKIMEGKPTPEQSNIHEQIHDEEHQDLLDELISATNTLSDLYNAKQHIPVEDPARIAIDGQIERQKILIQDLRNRIPQEK